MLETRAIVVQQIEDGRAIVEPIQGGSCGYCGGGKGCGSGKLTQLFCLKPRRYRVRNAIHAALGEEVQISVADGVLTRSVLLLYVLPILMLFVGALLGGGSVGASNNDTGAAIGAGVGLLIGFLLAGFIAKRLVASFSVEPAITRGKE